MKNIEDISELTVKQVNKELEYRSSVTELKIILGPYNISRTIQRCLPDVDTVFSSFWPVFARVFTRL